MNLTYMNLRNSLLAGTLTSAQLQTLLTSNNAYAAAMEAMAGHKGSVDLLTNSATAMATIQASGRALALLLSKEVGYVNAVNSQYFLQPGASGTRLRRDIFTSSGTWTYPGTISDMVILAIGAGGSGGAKIIGSSPYPVGGSGGQFVAKKITGVSANQTVTVGVGGNASSTSSGQVAGNNGGSTSFGSYITAAGGQGGTISGSGTYYNSAVGGGSGTWATWLDKAVTTAYWQPVFDIQGGASQSGVAWSYYRQAIDAIRTLAIGNAGITGNPPTPGTGYSAGGGNTTNGVGVSAAANSGCGGTASALTSGTPSSGAGGSGLLIVYYTLT